jgi:hypothetical protein
MNAMRKMSTKSVRWLSMRDMEAKLSQDYPPTGLVLRPTFHANIDNVASLQRWIGVASEHAEWLPGLDPSDAWAGLYGDMPFSIFGATSRDRYGLTASFPVVKTCDGTIDLGFLELLSLLPSDVELHGPYFETLPCRGKGYGVFRAKDLSRSHPVFRSPKLEEVVQVVCFLERHGEQEGLTVHGNVEDRPTWVLAGPDVGPYRSRVETFGSREACVRAAQQLSAKMGVPIFVYEAQLAGDPIVACSPDGEL